MKNIEYDIPIFESNDLADLDLYSEKMATAIKGQIDKFGNPLAFKGIKQNISELDLISNAQSGDIYGVIETNKNYIWNGKEWIIYSDIMELDNYYNKEEINKKIENIQALPVGGTKGQVLTKQSETDGDANWEDIEANEVFVGNEEEAPETAKIIIEDDDFEESAGLSKTEIFIGAEEPTAGEKVWFNKNKNSIYVRNSNGVYEEFAKKSEGLVDYTSYIEFNDKVTKIYNCTAYKKDNILFLNIDLEGNFPEGETVIGTIKRKLKLTAFGSGRLRTTNNKTIPATYIGLSKGAFRVHTTTTGTATAGNIILALEE